MPAGRPCRVITISSLTASRRYLERSTPPSARATSFAPCVGVPCLVEPRLRFGLRDDREDLDLRFCNVIEHPDVADAQAVPRLAQTPESLDPTLADFRRLVCQVHVQGRLDAGRIAPFVGSAGQRRRSPAPAASGAARVRAAACLCAQLTGQIVEVLGRQIDRRIGLQVRLPCRARTRAAWPRTPSAAPPPSPHADHPGAPPPS